MGRFHIKILGRSISQARSQEALPGLQRLCERSSEVLMPAP